MALVEWGDLEEEYSLLWQTLSLCKDFLVTGTFNGLTTLHITHHTSHITHHTYIFKVIRVYNDYIWKGNREGERRNRNTYTHTYIHTYTSAQRESDRERATERERQREREILNIST